MNRSCETPMEFLWENLTNEQIPCEAKDKCWDEMEIPNELWGPKNTKLSNLNQHQQEVYFSCYFAQTRQYTKSDS